MSWDRYGDAIVEIHLPDGPVVVGPRPLVPKSEVEFPAGGSTTIHVITAGNPGGVDQDKETDASARAALLGDLDRSGLTTFQARRGDLAWTHIEESVAVVGLSDDQALELGRKYGQQAIFAWSATSWELIASDGRVVSSSDWGIARGSAIDLQKGAPA